MKESQDGKYMCSLKVGTKGQIVIPKEVREMFNIESGDTLILLADKERGIALERYNVLCNIADAIFDGRAKSLYPNETEENSLQFAKAVKKIGDTENE